MAKRNMRSMFVASALVAAERFGHGSNFNAPRVELTGSGDGLKLFCADIDVDYPDVANASRAFQQSDVDTRTTNDNNEIIEVKIEYDGIVIANAT